MSSLFRQALNGSPSASFVMEDLSAYFNKLDQLASLSKQLESSSKLTRSIAFESERVLPSSGMLASHYSTTSDVRKYQFAMEEISGGMIAIGAAILAAIILAVKKFFSWLNGSSGGSGSGGGGGGVSKIARVENSSEAVKDIQKNQEEKVKVINDVMKDVKHEISNANIASSDIDYKPNEFNIDELVDRYVKSPEGKDSRLASILEGTDDTFNSLFYNKDFHKKVSSYTSMIANLEFMLKKLDNQVVSSLQGLVIYLPSTDTERIKNAMLKLGDAMTKFGDDPDNEMAIKDAGSRKEAIDALKDEGNIVSKKATFSDVIGLTNVTYTAYGATFDRLGSYVKNSQAIILEIQSKIEKIQAELAKNLEPAADKELFNACSEAISDSIKMVAQITQFSMNVLAFFVHYVDSSLKKMDRISESLSKPIGLLESELHRLKKQGVEIEQKHFTSLKTSKVVTGNRIIKIYHPGN